MGNFSCIHRVQKTDVPVSCCGFHDSELGLWCVPHDFGEVAGTRIQGQLLSFSTCPQKHSLSTYRLTRTGSSQYVPQPCHVLCRRGFLYGGFDVYDFAAHGFCSYAADDTSCRSGCLLPDLSRNNNAKLNTKQWNQPLSPRFCLPASCRDPSQVLRAGNGR